MPLLEITDLQVRYPIGDRRQLTAVNAVSIIVRAGESVGLVGESGCGKSSLGNAILRLAPISAGTVRFNGQTVSDLTGAKLKQFRRQVQMVFQDPYASLNPRLTVGAALDEVLAVHKLGRRPARQARVVEMLRQTGLDPEHAHRYPHELSGGQRQRVGIARALILAPQLVVADEPVSALDVSVQAQILKLMHDLQREMGLTWLFIAHDLAVVNYMCSRVYVMYLGRIIESGPANDLFHNPAHPYTAALVDAVPTLDRVKPRVSRPRIHGDITQTTDINGCPFHPRCPKAQDQCRAQLPELKEITPDRFCRCHFFTL